MPRARLEVGFFGFPEAVGTARFYLALAKLPR